MSRVPPLLNLAGKLLLVGLLAYAVTHQDMESLRGKAMVLRALTYPIGILVIPVVWTLMGRPRPYPHGADALLAWPFIIDIAGNLLGLYDSLVWFDDAAHTVTWMLLVLAVGWLIVRLELRPWNAAALAIGFGAASHILWEILEFVVMKVGAEGLQLTYEDTIGDLALSLTGSVIAGLLTGWRAARNGSPRRARSSAGAASRR